MKQLNKINNFKKYNIIQNIYGKKIWRCTKMKREQIIDAIKAMSVMELNELVKACEE